VTTPEPQSTPQVIPRPASVLAGGPPPWSGSPVATATVTLPEVLRALRATGHAGTAPAEPVLTGAELDRHPELGPTPVLAPAAVLVALFEEDGAARVLLTRRSATLRDHTGQVSFPGGRIDAGEDVTSAALREAEEEIGLDRSLVRVEGWLDSVQTVGSNTLVTPIVASLEARPHLSPSPIEVARVFDVSLASLMVDGVFHEERWPARSGPATYPVWFFDTDGETIWGATARILVSLLASMVAARGADRG
jgi:8-oxo-dGTP pyrophosphatase MutT (NUDIX family)